MYARTDLPGCARCVGRAPFGDASALPRRPATLCRDLLGNPREERGQTFLPPSARCRIRYIARRVAELRAFGSGGPVGRARETAHVVCVWLPPAPTWNAGRVQAASRALHTAS